MDKLQSTLIFFVNGKKVEVDSPSPETTLLQFLRRTLLLPGTKEACGQGGCGSCTVMVSQKNNKINHFSANACLIPICYLHGMAVTTVEGVGGTETGLHPVQVGSAGLLNVIYCSMNVLFSFDLFMVYLPECKQQLRNY